MTTETEQTPEQQEAAHNEQMAAIADEQTRLANPDAAPETPAEDPKVPERPENIPEKFWNAETGEVNTEALLKSQQDGEAELRRLQQEGKSTDKNQQTDQEGSEPESSAVDAARTEYAENRTLSDETYARLEKESGLTRQDVDIYIAGQEAIVTSLQNAAFGEFGGEQDNYVKATEWARENLSEDAIAALDVQLSSTNPAIVKEGAKALAAQYTANADISPDTVVNGDAETSTSGSFFKSSREMRQAMSDSRYEKDPAYRDEVARKIDRASKKGINLYS